MTPKEQPLKAVMDLGRLALQFGEVKRLTRHPDGVTLESDTTHTTMLGLIACSLAAQHYPRLNTGRLAALSLVHDLPEVYAGDTPTLSITPDEREAKASREAAAVDRLWREFSIQLPWLPRTIEDYESQASGEARFVKCVDKLLPKITQILNLGVGLVADGYTRADLELACKEQAEVLEPYFVEFPLLGQLYRGLYGAVLELEGL